MRRLPNFRRTGVLRRLMLHVTAAVTTFVTLLIGQGLIVVAQLGGVLLLIAGVAFALLRLFRSRPQR